MGGIEDLIDSRISAGENRKTLNRVSGARQASEKAESAKARAEESIEEAASKLGYINFDELWADGKLSGTLDGELPGVFIRNIAAEEILAGDIEADYLNVRGEVNVGPVTLDPEGITLPVTVGEEDPTLNQPSKIKPPGGWASLDFGEGAATRGAALNSVGTIEGTEGIIRLIAKTWAGASVTGNSTGRLIVRSTHNGRGIVQLQSGTDLLVDGYARFASGMTLDEWQNLDPLNGYSNASGQRIQQRITADRGHVELRGAVTGGTSGLSITRLPVNRRPPYQRQYIVGAGGGWARLNVDSQGYIFVSQSVDPNPGFIHFSGIVFEL